MRSLAASLAICLVAAAATPALALPRGVAIEPTGVTSVENRLLPRLFGGGEEKRRAEDDTAIRLDQLEQQVRTLTGQVEELTFTVRQLQQALATAQNGGVPTQQRGDVQPGPGTPPTNLGTLPANTSVAASNPAGTASGPIDLSVLNRPVQDPALAPRSTAPAAADPLASVREMQNSGRFARAAEEARTILASNPSGSVASEARFLLGEALLSQGDYREAANLFLENYTSDPNGARAPESLLKLGTALNGLGESEAACSSLDELFGAYPNIDASVRAAAERERQAANCA